MRYGCRYRYATTVTPETTSPLPLPLWSFSNHDFVLSQPDNLMKHLKPNERVNHVLKRKRNDFIFSLKKVAEIKGFLNKNRINPTRGIMRFEEK